ncbi:MAG TPA: enolase C-terminal domain-like protein [Ensifer sp.]|nr:enolase C-terminal domain-like protein [Ensifer sp.]
MKISRIEAFPFRLTPRRDFKWAGLRIDLGGFVAIRIETDEGLVGWGEATPLPDWGGAAGRRSGETQATVVAIIRDVIAPVLIGTDPTSVTAARSAMDKAVIGNSYAKCAVDIALHDIWGKSVGLPIYKLLGGAVRESVKVAHMVGLMGDAEAMEEAVGAIGDGLGALQIKGGVDPERDIRLIGALRKELGDAVQLRLDANQGYRDGKNASVIVQRLKDAGATAVEQPGANLAAMVEVTRNATIPVMADESCWDIVDAIDLAAVRGADWISIYLAKSGGILGARKVGVFAEALNMRCDVNGSIESAIGNAANLHFALATPSVQLPCVIPVSAPAGTHPYRIGGNYYEDDVVMTPFEVRDGAMLPIDRPGLGIEIDEDKLNRYRCD